MGEEECGWGGFGEEAWGGGLGGLPEVDNCFVAVVGVGMVVVGIVGNYREGIVVVDFVVVGVGMVVVGIVGNCREGIVVVDFVVREQRLPLGFDEERFAREEPHQCLVFVGRFVEIVVACPAGEVGSKE